MAMITVLHPGIETPRASAGAARTGAVRLASLAGKRVALLENAKVNARPILEAIGARLQSRHQAGEVRLWKKRHAGASGAAVIPDLVAWKPDLALCGIGD